MSERHLLEVIPKNLIQDDADYNIIEAIGNQEAKLFLEIDESVIDGNLERQSNEVMLHLLWENHLIKMSEGFALAETKQERADLIRSAVELHRYKGTPFAIERALKVVGIDGKNEEWFEYDGEPYRFLVELSLNQKLTDLDLIRSMIMEYKNERSWFDGFVILVLEQGFLFWDDSYSYPVYYKACGEFSGEKTFSQSSGEVISLVDDTYSYDVEYPVYEKEFRQADLAPVKVKDDTYGYIKRLPVAGEMEPLTKEVTTLSDATAVSAMLHDYSVTYPVCGEFYAEGDE